MYENDNSQGYLILMAIIIAVGFVLLWKFANAIGADPEAVYEASWRTIWILALSVLGLFGISRLIGSVSISLILKVFSCTLAIIWVFWWPVFDSMAFSASHNILLFDNAPSELNLLQKLLVQGWFQWLIESLLIVFALWYVFLSRRR